MKLVKRVLSTLALLLVAAALWIGLFPPSTPRIFLNQRRAVQSTEELDLGEHNYAARHPGVGFACKLRDLGGESSDPVADVDAVLASGTKAGYHFELQCPQSSDGKHTSYTVTAVPTNPGTTGIYALCSDQRGEIWYSENGAASDCLAMRRPVERKYKE